jgi:hypothetical protein
MPADATNRFNMTNRGIAVPMYSAVCTLSFWCCAMRLGAHAAPHFDEGQVIDFLTCICGSDNRLGRRDRYIVYVGRLLLLLLFFGGGGGMYLIDTRQKAGYQPCRHVGVFDLSSRLLYQFRCLCKQKKYILASILASMPRFNHGRGYVHRYNIHG